MMQQHLMQMQQPMMAAYGSPNNVTTDVIQQVFDVLFLPVHIVHLIGYLDENKQLILAILENQNSGKMDECAENQAKLQRNLMYLAAIADAQPQMPTVAQHFSPSSVMQSGPRYVPAQQAQQMTPQSLMAARSSMLYGQPPLSVLQQQQQQQQQQHQQQQQQQALHSHLGMLHGDTGMGGSRTPTTGGFSDFGRSGAGKQDAGNTGPSEGRGGNSGGQNGDGTEPLYMKGSEGEGN